MKVLLLQDVKNTGKKGQVVEVSDGYARNFLIAKKLGEPATAQTINAAKNAEEAARHKKQVEENSAKELARTLSGKNVTVKVRAGENGKLFGAMTSKEIADAITEQLGIKVDKKEVELDGNIKNLGDYEVTVRVYANTTAKIKVTLSAL